MSEATFTRKLCRDLRKAGISVQRLEDMYSTGIPDIVLVHKNITVFVEAKFTKNEVQRSRKIGLRPDQVVWLHKWNRGGGNCLIADRAGSTLRIFHGKHSRELDESLKKNDLDSLAAYIGRGNEHKALLNTIELLFS